MPKIYAGCLLIIATFSRRKRWLSHKGVFEISERLRLRQAQCPAYIARCIGRFVGREPTALTDGNGDFAFQI
jgi:hypothetical protein